MGEEFSDFTTHLQWRLLLNLLAYSVRLPISLGHVVLPSALVMLDIFFYFTRGGLIIQRASCIMVDVFRVFKEMKYIVCFTSDEILIIYRKIKITQILSALL